MRPEMTPNAKRGFLVAMLVAPTLASAATPWPSDSSGDLSIFAIQQRFRMYADQCSTAVPALKPGFDKLTNQLVGRVEIIGRELLSSDAFKALNKRAAPKAVVQTLMDELEGAKKDFLSLDLVFVCPKTLDNLGNITDDVIRAGLTKDLAGMQDTLDQGK